MSAEGEEHGGRRENVRELKERRWRMDRTERRFVR
jgi:hypothetical protein